MKNNQKNIFLKYLMLPLTFVAMGVCIKLYSLIAEKFYAGNIFVEGDIFFTVCVNTLLLFFVFLIGFALLTFLGSGFSLAMHTALAFPVGLVAVFCTAFVLLMLHLPFNAVSITVLLFLMLVGFYTVKKLINKKQSSSFKVPSQRKNIYIILCIAIVLCGVAAMFPFKFASFDSTLYYQYYSNLIVRTGEIQFDYIPFVLSVGQFEPFIAAAFGTFGIMQTFGVQIMLVFCMLFAFGIWCFGHLQVTFSPKKSCGISILIAVLLGLQVPVLILTGWLLSNVYMMCYLFFACLAAAEFLTGKENTTKTTAQIFALGAFCLAVSLIRMEALFFVMLLLLAFTRENFSKKELVFGVLTPTFVVNAIYYFVVFVINKVPDSEVFIGRSRAVLMLLLLAVLAFYVLLPRQKNFLWCKTKAHWYTIFALVAMIAFFFYLYPQKMGINLNLMGRNLFNVEFWGFGGIMLFVSFVVVIIYKRFRLSFLDIFIVTYILFNFALFGMRENSVRASYTDSLNRILAQVVPCIIFAIAYSIFKENKADKKEQIEKDTVKAK